MLVVYLDWRVDGDFPPQKRLNGILLRVESVGPFPASRLCCRLVQAADVLLTWRVHGRLEVGWAQQVTARHHPIDGFPPGVLTHGHVVLDGIPVEVSTESTHHQRAELHRGSLH